MRRLSLSLLLCLVVPAAADTYTLSDGSRYVGWLIGEAGGELTILTDEGRKRDLLRAELEAVEAGEAPTGELAEKLAKYRKRFLSTAERKLDRLVRKYAKADSAEERAALAAELRSYDPGARVEPLRDALDHRDAHVRLFANEELGAIGDRDAVWALVRTSLTSNEAQPVSETYTTAIATDAVLTREFYEAVAAQDVKADRRLRAVHFLGAIGNRASVPALIQAVETAGLEVRAQLSRGRLQDSQPLDLGTLPNQPTVTGGAVQLPLVSRTGVSTKVIVPTAMWKQVSSDAASTLTSLTGQDFGTDADAWRDWYAAQAD